MESLRHQRSPGSERFLGLFSPPDNSTATAAVGGVEFNEDEILWTAASYDPLDSSFHPPSTGSPKPRTLLSPSPSSRASFRRQLDRSFGILAALPEDEGNISPRSGSSSSSGGDASAPFLQRKASISSSSSSASNSPSSSSAARMIPAVPKPEYTLSVPGGRIHQPQSAPVNVPLVPSRMRRSLEELQDVDNGETCDDVAMLPPHEIVARTYSRSPMTTFSVLEGAGRTLKGRDLRQVRNAVFRQTGFLD